MFSITVAVFSRQSSYDGSVLLAQPSGTDDKPIGTLNVSF